MTYTCYITCIYVRAGCRTGEQRPPPPSPVRQPCFIMQAPLRLPDCPFAPPPRPVEEGQRGDFGLFALPPRPEEEGQNIISPSAERSHDGYEPNPGINETRKTMPGTIPSIIP